LRPAARLYATAKRTRRCRGGCAENQRNPPHFE
jgi:hypothetical protein